MICMSLNNCVLESVGPVIGYSDYSLYINNSLTTSLVSRIDELNNKTMKIRRGVRGDMIKDLVNEIISFPKTLIDIVFFDDKEAIKLFMDDLSANSDNTNLINDVINK